MKTLEINISIEKINNRMDVIEFELTNHWSILHSFKNPEMLKLISEWHTLKDERIRLLRDLESCNSEDPDDMCRSCNCWKATRANCS